MKKNPLIGKTIAAVFLAANGEAIRFDLVGDESITVYADGDCCSHSWIENVDGVEQMIGSPVVAVEDVMMPDLGSPDEWEEIVYYGCRITTGIGFATIDYRNSSNGYYGGNLVWPRESLYGGVYCQNGNPDDWRQLAPTGGKEQSR
jgi:hypothetical protein